MFIALDVCISWIKSLRPVIAAVRKHDRSLAEQIQEASKSVALTVAEGSKRMGRDRGHHYNVAAGSHFEARTGVRIAEANGYLDKIDTSKSDSLGDRAGALV